MSNENKIINKIRDIYILSKQVNKINLNIIKIKQMKSEIEEKRIFFNQKYNKKNISILKYYIENIKNIRIFGNLFVKENRKRCRIILNNKEYELKSFINKEYELKSFIKANEKKNLNIKLKIYEYLINIEEMFKECQAIRKINKLNTLYVTNMSRIFFRCYSLSSLPDISKWITNNVNDMSYLFYECSLLSSLPDISNWNTNNVNYMNNIFSGCSSLSFLPDISKWNTNNVKDIKHIFCGCSSLSSLPNISKWNTSNVIYMNYIFCGCSSLSSLPDISKWNTNNVIDMGGIFLDVHHYLLYLIFPNRIYVTLNSFFLYY